MALDVPVEGICLYPVLDYSGFDDDRHCDVGLLGHADAAGRRPIHVAFAAELKRQQVIFGASTGAEARSGSLLGSTT
jgi:hypothetical protein